MAACLTGHVVIISLKKNGRKPNDHFFFSLANSLQIEQNNEMKTQNVIRKIGKLKY